MRRVVFSRRDVLFGGTGLVALVSSWSCAGNGDTRPPAPVPTAIELSPPSPSIPDSTGAGSPVATIVVAMSDGGSFAGTLGFATSSNNSGEIFAINNDRLRTTASLPTGASTQNVTI